MRCVTLCNFINLCIFKRRGSVTNISCRISSSKLSNSRCRVRTVLRTSSGDVSSVLSIKSAILDDAGNYTCRHDGSGEEDTVRIIVVDGELEDCSH